MIELGDIFENEDLSFPERRDSIVTRIREDQFVLNHDDKDELLGLVDELQEAVDSEDFDQVWDEIYDWADVNLVWIDTVRTNRKTKA